MTATPTTTSTARTTARPSRCSATATRCSSTYGAAAGSFKPALQFYLLKIHGGTATAVSSHLKSFDSLGALQHSAGEGWASGHDRYGDVTYLRVAAMRAASITLDMKR